jgi:hypothetical protein
MRENTMNQPTNDFPGVEPIRRWFKALPFAAKAGIMVSVAWALLALKGTFG